MSETWVRATLRVNKAESADAAELVPSQPQLLRMLGTNDGWVTKLGPVTTGTRINSVRSFDRK